MSSDQNAVIHQTSEMYELDDLVKQAASLFRLSRWRGGFQGTHVSTDKGLAISVNLHQFEELQQDLTPYEDHALVKQIDRLILDLGLVQKKPDYQAFRSIFKKSTAGKTKPKIAFLLGAGASKPTPSSIPTITEMLDVIVSKLPPSENPMTNKIKEWASDKAITIEDIMTAGYLGSQFVSNPRLNRLVGEIVYRTPARTQIERGQSLFQSLEMWSMLFLLEILLTESSP